MKAVQTNSLELRKQKSNGSLLELLLLLVDGKFTCTKVGQQQKASHDRQHLEKVIL